VLLWGDWNAWLGVTLTARREGIIKDVVRPGKAGDKERKARWQSKRREGMKWPGYTDGAGQALQQPPVFLR
jgi:hypothetical protein